jgi:hypothetical protein
VDAKSSLGDAKSSLGDAESSLGDAKSSLGDAKSTLGDAESLLDDAESSLGDAKSSLGDAKSSALSGDARRDASSGVNARMMVSAQGAMSTQWGKPASPGERRRVGRRTWARLRIASGTPTASCAVRHSMRLGATPPTTG